MSRKIDKNRCVKLYYEEKKIWIIEYIIFKKMLNDYYRKW